ncbi:MAG: cyclic pyranopterin monophosphate synthase MoaC [Candidatus Bathyarchaeota archaeon]|nr:cyclic pyranopterin monophosphate synthase MoaC [Candidatus Bathyarchaeota archaeon]MDH5623974.1 cyclic pyranopterin monophosphate synthase MoaC [Candidatus Bathyarchaeota archaeon]MDH5635504.1 cyclic pyranopterin monophosphate synthase MoaC [Candidatus Bathyarchaeota archaeon]MDH5702308.1 cyclic pyranopterin monophosphate synthase MoaC [Candidatus Bathyarchaeota archaeon]
MSMVDVTEKPEIYREAKAKGAIKLKPETILLIREGKVEKGDPFHVAKVAGILAAKNTSSLIPLCHPLPLTNVEVDLQIVDDSTVEVKTTVKTRAQTGVEMEALAAATVALLTVWDMTKQYEKDKRGQYPHTVIQDIRVIRKMKEEGT